MFTPANWKGLRDQSINNAMLIEQIKRNVVAGMYHWIGWEKDIAHHLDDLEKLLNTILEEHREKPNKENS